MPFVIDDVAIAAAADAAVEVGGEIATEAAEGVGESTELLGDGIGEDALELSGEVDFPELPDSISDEQLDIKGDGLGESSLEESHHIDSAESSKFEQIDPSDSHIDSNTQEYVDDKNKSEFETDKAIPKDTVESNPDYQDNTNMEKGDDSETSIGNMEQPEVRKTGGRYGDLKSAGWGWNSEPPKEVHHIPADTASPLEKNDGPAIAMDPEDHKLTASCGNSQEAKEYRAAQKKLIEEGKFREAIQIDIDDLRDKFGDKYEVEIQQMLDYVDELEKNGKI